MNLRFVTKSLAFFALGSLVYCGAHGQVVSFTAGQFELITPPSSVENGAIATNQNLIHIFVEGSFVASGSEPLFDLKPTGGAELFNGQNVVSVFLDFDPANSPPAVGLAGGTVTFDRAILGLYFLDDSLDLTDGDFGYSGTTYPTNTQVGRGVEFAGPIFPDNIIIGASTLDVSALFTTLDNDALDQVRILLVPEPSTYAALLGAVVLLIVAVRQVRNRRKLVG